ncbi:MAG TPA: anhydro-N-acetylmuramic acid kinase [Thermotogota bacterium]|nr:anhydro-N-acetylmuramic acid kinase [Thermotogota bacterium]HRW34527.1 anhydro-N-acetylmuramic acid kinase [Thermotogota bacterium]
MKKIIATMSGTSCDGLDIVYCEIEGSYTDTNLVRHLFTYQPYGDEMSEKLKMLTSGKATVGEIARANVYLAQIQAQLINRFIQENHLEDVELIVSHGQTVFHDTNPSDDSLMPKCTLQIGDGDYISCLTGIPVLSDLRMKDMAVGGQGAPLVVYTDYILFSSDEESVGLQNIGGIGNITIIRKDSGPDEIIAFDTGPGNILINQACEHYLGVAYDQNGQYSKNGTVVPLLLSFLWEIEEDYFTVTPPKSTGREIRYHQAYFKKIVDFSKENGFAVEDILKTVVEFTAQTMVQSYKQHAFEPDRLIVSGGGSKNPTLIEAIKHNLIHSRLTIMDESLNDAKEAIAFALMGNEYLNQHYANIKSATGACRSVRLGKLSIPD